MMPVVGANLIAEQGCSQREIGAEHQDGLALVKIADRRQFRSLAAERVEQGDHVAGAVVIDVVGLEHLARELLQVEVLFVGGVVGTDHAEAAAGGLGLGELLRHGLQGLRPGHFFQLAVDAHQGRLQALGVIVEIEGVASLDAEELAVDAAAVAIVAADDLVVARAQRGLAAIAAVRADGADVGHFPGARLVAVGAAGERADRADIDAGAALVAFQVIADVGRDLADHAAIDDAERAHAQAFIADAHAAEAQDAARRIEVDHRGELLFRSMNFFFRVAAFAGAVAEDHVLQFALAALIADRAIERVIGEQELQRVLARLFDLLGLGAHHHAFGHRQSACRHHLRHLFHFHQAHAAGGRPA